MGQCHHRVMTVSVRPLGEGDIGPVVELSVRAWKPVFESMCRVLGPEIFKRVYPDWAVGQAQAVESVCRADGTSSGRQGIGLSLICRAVEEISKLGIPLVEIGTGGDAGATRPRGACMKKPGSLRCRSSGSTTKRCPALPHSFRYASGGAGVGGA